MIEKPSQLLGLALNKSAREDPPPPPPPESGLNRLAAEAHETAASCGWWDSPPEFPTVVALCHSELSEALEAHRNGRGMKYVGEELADCVLRILDYCGREGIDIERAIREKADFNKRRAYRHGGKAY